MFMLRIYNNSRPQCFDIIKVRLQLLPRIVLNTPVVACIPDSNFDLNEIFNLTSVSITTSFPAVNPSDLTLTYYNSLANANNQTNPIGNPSSFNVYIPNGQSSLTIYISASANGYCSGVVPIELKFCVADGGDGGGGGGGGGSGGGFGGLGACLEIGDTIPTYDLNIVYTNVMSAIPIFPVPTPLGFYTTLLGAQTQDNAMLLSAAQITAFTPSSPFSAIWVRYIDANGIAGIKKIIVPLKFKKHEVRDVYICDIFNNNSEFIDLQNTPNPASYLQQIRNENPGETVTAYATLADYLSNTNPITLITISGLITTVYVKVSSFGCDSDYKLNFNLVPFNINSPITKNVCDIDSDGTEVFDLTTLLSTITNPGYINPSLTIHPSLNDAYLDTNSITNPTTYQVTATTTVFVRMDEEGLVPAGTIPLCPTIQEFNFGFFDSVNINTIGNQEYCDLENDNQIVLGNLNALITSIVIENQTEPIIKKLYTNLAAAQTSNVVYEILPDWDLFTYDTTILGTTGTIYLQLTNSVTGCMRIVPINIQIKTLPLTVNSTVQYCDFNNDNSEILNFI